jgi:agmatinase
LALTGIKKGGFSDSKADQKKLAQVNAASDQVNEWVYAETKKLIETGQDCWLSSAAITAFRLEPSKPFRKSIQTWAYFISMPIPIRVLPTKGFTHSHASIFYNVLKKIPKVSKIVQVGIRDFCEEEVEVVGKAGEKMEVFLDQEMYRAKASGRTMADIAKTIVQGLPSDVYVSFDVDGFDPKLCPGTGTPVPGGLEYHDAIAILREVVNTGRRIVGFDVNEVSPANGGEWNANVGARLLYKLCSFALLSNKLVKPNNKLPPNFAKLV